MQSISDEVGRLRIKASPNRFVYDYYLTDNQGNTRMAITDVTTQSSYILEAMNYYPFGLEMNGIDTKSTGLLHNSYNYQGKELQNTESPIADQLAEE